MLVVNDLNQYMTIRQEDYFDTCIIWKDFEGNNATLKMKTIGLGDDRQAVVDSDIGEVYYNQKARTFTMHFCACRCYTK